MIDVDNLKSIVLLSYLDESMLKKILKVTQTKTYEAGDYIFREGDYADSLYAVVQGKVGLEMEKTSSTRVLITTVTKGYSFGISSLVETDERKYMNSAKALSKTEVFSWRAADLGKMFHEDYEMGFLFMRRIAKILKSRLEDTRAQSLDIYR
jgi:CRP-like cAMP-binding protein